MLLGLIGKPIKQWVHVNIGKELEEAGLATHFPVEVARMQGCALGNRLIRCVVGLALNECDKKIGHQD